MKNQDKTNIRIQKTIYDEAGNPVGLSKVENIENERVPKYTPIKTKTSS